MSAIVVNHNAGASLAACVASLRDAGVSEVIVVDNASSDGSLVELAEADHDAILVPAGRNLGYGTAVNLGARRASHSVLLVCNPDLVLEPDAPSRLAGLLEACPDVAAVGPTVLEPGGERYPSARSFPSIVDAAGHAILSLFRPDNPFTRRYRLVDVAFEGPTDVDWVSGSCVALRADAFFSVGGFDQSYFMYVEDLDLCWRLHRAGWRVVHLPEARVTHVGGVSARRHPYAMLVAHHRSTWRFFSKSATGTERLLLPVIGAGLAVRLLAAVVLEARSRAGTGATSAGGAVE